MPEDNITQLAHFEVHLTALDHPTDRRRWNGDPMASHDADIALHDAVEAFRDVLKDRGFEVVRTGYGVHATVEADQSRWPAHLRDNAPYKTCDACGRKSWSPETRVGTSCGMPQPSGPSCEGHFIETEPGRRHA